MSNRITVQFTKFIDIDETGEENTVPIFGYRVYDSYGKDYNNTFESLEELNAEVSKDTLLDVVRSLEGFADVDEDTCDGIDFNDTFYDWDELNGKEEEEEHINNEEED